MGKWERGERGSEHQSISPHCTTLHHTAPHCTTLHHIAPHRVSSPLSQNGERGSEHQSISKYTFLDTIIGLFCKRALEKRRYYAKETCKFKEPTLHIVYMCVFMDIMCIVGSFKL